MAMAVVTAFHPPMPFFEGNGGYDIWSIKMKTLFISQDLWELVDQGYAEEQTPTTAAIRDIRKRDAMALFFIQQAIGENIFPQISKATKSKEAWDALQKKYYSTIEVSAQDGDGDGNETEMRVVMDDSVYKAAANGDTEVLIMKLPGWEESQLLQYLSPKHNTILHISSEFGQTDCVKWILGSFTSSSLLPCPNLDGDTALHLAAREGHLEVIKALINNAPSDVENHIGMLRMGNKGNYTAFHEAVRYGHSEVVKFLIDKDPYLACITIDPAGGISPLYMAAERGFTDVVEIVIDKSTSAPCTGFMGRTILHAAVMCNNQAMTEMILGWKSDLTKQVDKNGWSPLHCAAERGCEVQIVKLLLEKSDKSVPYLGTKDNKTALHIASLHHHTEIVEEILSHSPGCREQVDHAGNNVFHFAMMQKGDHDFAFYSYFKNKWLAKRGLVNEKDVHENTPLHILSSFQNYHLGFIWRQEVDIKARNRENLTAYDKILIAKQDISGKKDEIQWRFESVLPETRSSFGEKENKKLEKEKQSKEYREKRTSELQKQGETHLIVSALITTVTFAAGFTLPGGYKEDDGEAILSKKAAFIVFVVADTIAMVSSLCAVFLHFFMTMRKGEKFLERHLISAFVFIMIGMGAMVIAFTTGLYAVLPHSSALSFLTCILCSCFFLSFIFEYYQFYKYTIFSWYYSIKYWLIRIAGR